MRTRLGVLCATSALAALLAGTTACSPASGTATDGTITAIGAENEYANVIQQIGGKYVSAQAIMSNPGTDPHTFEASPSVAREVSQASLIVQNGLGYDSWADTIENAAPDPNRKVIDVQKLLKLPDSTPNPHLWYDPSTMPRVANAIAADLASVQPAHANYFRGNAAAFVTTLAAWTNAVTRFKKAHPHVPVATTEPVADYLLRALGTDNLTPWAFQSSTMNGTDPSPQDVTAERSLFTRHKVKAFLYNQQVTDPLTESLIKLAHENQIPVIGVYETMPAPGYDYQSWMLSEVTALEKAVTSEASTQHL